MRTNHRCPKCDHDEVVYAPELRDSDSDEMRIATSGVWSPEAIGTFEVYFCRACGYAELYVKNPSSVDPEKIHGAKVLKASPPKAYR